MTTYHDDPRARGRAAATYRRGTLRRRTSVVLTTLATTGVTCGALAAASDASISTYVETGSQGSAVSQVQSALGVPVTGVFGPSTRTAVVAFQSNHGLGADGIVGPVTGTALGIWAGGSTGSSSTTATTTTSGSSTYSGSTSAGGSTTTSAPSSTLQRIAQCESGGNAGAISPGGTYRGKYQFDMQTWASVGGTGDPAAAPASVQDALAAKLLARSGTAPWPVCGR